MYVLQNDESAPGRISRCATSMGTWTLIPRLSSGRSRVPRMSGPLAPMFVLYLSLRPLISVYFREQQDFAGSSYQDILDVLFFNFLFNSTRFPSVQDCRWLVDHSQ